MSELVPLDGLPFDAGSEAVSARDVTLNPEHSLYLPFMAMMTTPHSVPNIHYIFAAWPCRSGVCEEGVLGLVYRDSVCYFPCQLLGERGLCPETELAVISEGIECFSGD